MSRPLPVALVQAPPRPATAPLSGFAAEVGELIARFPQTRLVVYPELHLCGVTGAADGSEAELWAAAEPLDGPRARQLAELAGDLGIWLVPGSVCERGPDGELFNTALAFSPEGRLAASYRKIFPWRPLRALRPRRPLRRARPAGDRPGRLLDLLRRLVPRGGPPPRLDGRRGDHQPGHDHDRRPRPGTGARPRQRHRQPGVRASASTPRARSARAAVSSSTPRAGSAPRPPTRRPPSSPMCWTSTTSPGYGSTARPG